MLPRKASASMGGLVLALQFVGHFRNHGTSLCAWTIAATEHLVGVFFAWSQCVFDAEKSVR